MNRYKSLTVWMGGVCSWTGLCLSKTKRIAEETEETVNEELHSRFRG